MTPTEETEPFWESWKFRKALKKALEEDHCWADCGNACDIHAAYEEGHYLWAAHLLTGATECPALERVFEKYGDVPWDVVRKDCDEFADSVPNVECPGCGSVCWGVVYDEAYVHDCGHCGEELRRLTPGFLDAEMGETFCRACALKRDVPLNELKFVKKGTEFRCEECYEHCRATKYTLADAIKDANKDPNTEEER